MKLVESSKIYDGEQRVYEHRSARCSCDMRFAVYYPPAAFADGASLPVLFWLSGLTCTEQNFITKAGAQRYAAEHSVVLVAPDTSPRGDDVPDDQDSYDFGQGAGFYCDATEQPWQQHYQMHSYIVEELYELVLREFPVDSKRVGIFGHSMGGHGALTIHMKHPEKFKSVSAFAPIVSPTTVPWGLKALSRYLGEDPSTWQDYDACLLAARGDTGAAILIDQGSADNFLEEQLKPQLLEQACAKSGQSLRVHHRQGYDHSYNFIATYIESHILHHLEELS